MLHRILTENKNKEEVLSIVSEYFDGFTVIESIGYWKGQAEPSLIIELDVHPTASYKVEILATHIKRHNQQEAVMVQEFTTHTKLV